MIRIAFVTLVATLAVSAAFATEPSTLVRLAKARVQALHPLVTAYGTVAPDPDHLTTVALPREGIVVSVAVRAGQFLHIGDSIVTIQTAPSAQAAYQQAQSALAFARKDLAHTRELYSEWLATKSQLANAQKAVSDARAQIEAQTKIGASKVTEVLRATTPGIITTLNASPGDRVQAGAAIASIATRNQLLVNLGLEPSDALQASAGDKVWLHSPQQKTIAFAGKIQSVDAMMDPKSRLVNAVVTIPPNVASELVLGMVLEGEIELAAKTGVVVPHDALMTDKYGTYVFVVSDRVAHRHNVHVALETDKNALIAQGVAAGDEIVVAGGAGLEDGTHVRVH
ncbi:MAG: efflux RND transporter periplasmic adaptor subunit [Proteobacteria bacterium]|nr:efflux RND transporter periplasmic adaptor subunit [Pseudomonadota bacterium]